MTTPSGDPYQYGDDTVAARLEVDIPTDAISNLSDLSKHTADIRANMEATAKYNQDYVEYLRQLPSVLGEVDSAQGRLSASRSSIFGGESVTRDDRTPTARFVDGQPGAGRTPRADIDQDTLIGLARNNPRQVANMAADRGLDRYFDDDQSYVLPRTPPGPGPSPGSGRPAQFAGGGRPPSQPRGPRWGTGPGDDDGRAAGTTTGRQVTPEGTENQAERAATRLLEELENRDAQSPGMGGRLRNIGSGVESNQFLNYLSTEGGTRGQSDLIGFAGGLGRMAQQSGEGFVERQEEREAEKQSLLATAADVATVNPDLAKKLTERAAGMGGGGLARLAPLAKGAGVVGAGVAGAAAIYAGVQKAGEWGHSMQGHGVQMGGGFSEGLAFEAQIRTMAMNPFISTEQSRKIMQQALQSGYTGKEMDTVTEFMAENLKSMNMEAAESMKLLRQNVLAGGQSIESLEGQLSGNLALARETDLSKDQVDSQFSQISGQAVGAGAGGAEGGAYAQSLIATFGDDPLFKEQGSTDLSDSAFGNINMQRDMAREAGVHGEVLTQHVPSYLMGQEGGPSNVAKNQRNVIRNALTSDAALFAKPGATPRDKSRAVQQADYKLKNYGLRWDPNQIAALLSSIASGEWDAQTEAGLEQAEQLGGGDMIEGYDDIDGEGLGTSWRKGMATISGNDEAWENADADAKRGQAGDRLRGQLRDASGYNAGTKETEHEVYTPSVLREFAIEEHEGRILDTTIVVDGKERKLTEDDLRNEAFMQRLQSGDVSIKSESGVQTLQEWAGTQESDVASASGNMFNLHVDISDEFKDVLRFRLEGPNEVQQKADRGDGAKNSNEASLHPFGNPGGR